MKRQRSSGKAALFVPSSSRKLSRRRNSTKATDENSDKFLFRLMIRRSKSWLSSASTDTITTIAVLALSVVVIMISRLNCFHVHYGMNDSLSNLKPIGSTAKYGYTDFHFRGDVKTTYDQEALDLLKENPLLKIEDLDLGFVFEIDKFGADAIPIGSKNRTRRNLIASVGKSTDEIVFHITGERIRNALRQTEARMPRPSQI